MTFERKKPNPKQRLIRSILFSGIVAPPIGFVFMAAIVSVEGARINHEFWLLQFAASLLWGVLGVPISYVFGGLPSAVTGVALFFVWKWRATPIAAALTGFLAGGLTQAAYLAVVWPGFQREPYGMSIFQQLVGVGAASGVVLGLTVQRWEVWKIV
jgi:hypothetical protein